jgi:hypothetical protein
VEAIAPRTRSGEVVAVREDQLRLSEAGEIDRLTNEYATEHNVQNPPLE